MRDANLRQERERTTSAWARRGPARPLLAAVAATLAISCGSPNSGAVGGSASATTGPSVRYREARVRVASTVLGEPGSASTAAASVEGAAALVHERAVPPDIVPLSARMVAREVPIPETARGNTQRFTFDGQRRGWFVRVPGHGQALLTPTFHGGRVYTTGGFSSGQYFAYDAFDGSPLWAASAPAGGPSAAVVADGKLLFNTESCTLFAVDVDSGENLWSRWLGDPLMSTPAAAGGFVYSGHVLDARSPGRLRPGTRGWGTGGGRRYGFTALELGEGTPRWTTGISADVLNAPVVAERSIFVTTMNGDLYRLDRRSGRVRWHHELSATSAPWIDGDRLLVSARVREPQPEGGESAEPSGADEPAVAGHAREHLLVLDQRRGEIQRELDAVDAGFLHERADHGGVAGGWAYEGSRPTVHDGRMYQTIGNEVHCREADTGHLLWRREYTDDRSARPASSPAIAGSQLVFGTTAGVLYGLEVDGGLTTFAYDVGEPIAAQPTIAEGWVYAGTTQGGLVALEISDPSFDGWHMWGGNATHTGPTVRHVDAPEARRGRRARGGRRGEVTAADGAAAVANATLGANARQSPRPPEGTLRLDDEPNQGELGGFPLTRTEVSASVHGFVATVRIEQTFDNPYERVVGASYLFPVPDGASVEQLDVRTAGRHVRARIAARRAPEAEGTESARRTSVQTRADLFSHRMRALPAGETVTVRLVYSQVLEYRDGEYHLPYPLRAGPRYTRATGDRYNAAGTPLERALEPGDTRPDAVEIAVEADHDNAASSSHELDVQRARGRTVARLEGDAPPERDLDVRFAVAGAEPSALVVASPPVADERGHFALALHPRLEVPDAEIPPREISVVIDTSSSMRGRAMERMRSAAGRLLAGLRPNDRFRITVLDDSTRFVAGGASPTDRAAARRFLAELEAEGVTGARDGLVGALSAPREEDRIRMLVLMSDGYLGNETFLMRDVAERIGQTRVFAFGIGSAVNRYFLTRLSEMGRGALVEATLSEPVGEPGARLAALLSRPALTDLSIEWGELSASDVYPRRLPDLYADRPLVVHGRYPVGGESQVTIRGRIAGRPFTQVLEVELPEVGAPHHRELAAVWARARIEDLRTAMSLAEDSAAREEATRLAVEHQLLTEWTTFEVEDSREGPPPISTLAPELTSSPSERPAQGTQAPVVGCYAQVRAPDGSIDPEELARCLAEAGPSAPSTEE